MDILGISAFYHDSAACLIRDGKVIAAAQEERFTRVKHDSSFPYHAIQYCLKAGNIAGKDIDMVSFYEKPMLKFDRVMETFLQTSPQTPLLFSRAMSSWFSEKFRLPEKLKEELGFEGKIVFASHHEAHAASAFFLSPYSEAAILTVDGVGEWTTNALSSGEGNRVTLLEELTFPHSLGLLYSSVTQYLGFRVNWGEYKVMGLAPYGNPVYADRIREQLIDIKEDGSYRLFLDKFEFLSGQQMIGDAFGEVFGVAARIPESELTQFHMDIARSLQEVTNEILVKQARFARNTTNSPYLCMAGGVALNCVANGKIAAEGIFRDVWVQPAAHDAGGCLGAALVAWHHVLEQPIDEKAEDGMSGGYLGPDVSDYDIEAALRAHGLDGERLGEEELIERVATLLSEQAVIGWVQGGMEFGPRALGNRSILADPRAQDMQSRVNQKIKFREGFRPFAPSVLEEDRAEWFEFTQSSPYMLFVAPVSEQVRIAPESPSVSGLERLGHPRSKIQAVTHVDFSARLQTVSEERNSRFYRLIQAFKKRTGIPMLLNTSFNLRGEPICAGPGDAIASFLASDMDALVLDETLVMRPEGRKATGVTPPLPSPRKRPLKKHPTWLLVTVGVLLCVLSLLGANQLMFRQEMPLSLQALFGGMGSLLLLMTLFARPRLHSFQRHLERGLRFGIQKLSFFFMLLVYLLVVSPLSVLKRLFSRSVLETRPEAGLESYWEKGEFSESYERMY